jgi:hypothetical protein
MEPEKLLIPVNPRGMRLCSGSRMPAKMETADKSTKRQLATPVDSRARSCQKLHRFTESAPKPLRVFLIFPGSFNSSSWSSLMGYFATVRHEGRKQS